MKYFTRLSFFLLFTVALASCEKQEYFKSESEIKKQLSHSWKEILMGGPIVILGNGDTLYFDRYQLWTFEDDKVTIIIKNRDDDTPIDTLNGNFSVRTTLTKVFMTTSNFPNDPAWYWLNAEWTVVALDSKGLVIASEDPHAGGINEREFTRVD